MPVYIYIHSRPSPCYQNGDPTQITTMDLLTWDVPVSQSLYVIDALHLNGKVDVSQGPEVIQTIRGETGMRETLMQNGGSHCTNIQARTSEEGLSTYLDGNNKLCTLLTSKIDSTCLFVRIRIEWIIMVRAEVTTNSFDVCLSFVLCLPNFPRPSFLPISKSLSDQFLSLWWDDDPDYRSNETRHTWGWWCVFLMEKRDAYLEEEELDVASVVFLLASVGESFLTTSLSAYSFTQEREKGKD